MSTRQLNTATLDEAAKHYAIEFMKPDRMHPRQGHPAGGRAYTMENFFKFTYLDEFEYLMDRIRGNLGTIQLQEFDKAAANHFEPRDPAVFEQLLADTLAIYPDGEHIPGKIGTLKVETRVVGFKARVIQTSKGERTIPANVYWPV